MDDPWWTITTPREAPRAQVEIDPEVELTVDELRRFAADLLVRADLLAERARTES